MNKRKKSIELRKTKSPQLNKALINIEETLNDIDDKLNELRELDKGSKFFAILGWLLMGSGGGGALTLAVTFKDVTNPVSYAIFFIMASLITIIMIAGFMMSHKGLTGDWL